MKCLICGKDATMSVVLEASYNSNWVIGYYCTKDGELKRKELQTQVLNRW